jgi:hypothetical protein
MCTQYLHYIHPPSPFPNSSLFPVVLIPQAAPVLPSCFLIFYKKRRRRRKKKKKKKRGRRKEMKKKEGGGERRRRRRNDILCFFKTVTQTVFLWHFIVYMHYRLIWSISSIFLLSTLVPFLWWFKNSIFIPV